MASRPEEPTEPDHQPYVAVHTPRLSQSGAEATKILDVSEDAAATNKQVPLAELFSFADSIDKLLMGVGTLGALVAGVLRPLMVVLLGNVINSFGSTSLDGGSSADISPRVNRVARNLTIVGAVGLVAAYLQVYCWSLTASRQSKRIRSLYVNAIITKEIGWFDVNDPMQLSSRVTEATITIQDGIGSKMSDMLHFSSTVVAGIVIGLVKGWELTLILLAVIPFVAVSGMVAKKVIVAATHSGMQSYAQAGAVAQESLSNIRTVHMFNSVGYFVEKYSRALEGATRAGIKKSFAVGWGSGLMYMMIFLMYALGFFIGAVFVARDNLDGNSCTGSSCYDGGRVLTVFFAVLQGAMALGQAGPNLQAVFSACAAAFDVFELIKRPSLIDPTNDTQGKTLNTVSGSIDIDNFMALGGVSSVFKGAVYPLAGMFIAKIIHLYFELQKTKHELLHDMRYYSLALGCLAIVCGASFTLTEYWFGIASSRLVTRVRLATYSAMLRQEAGWFDHKENSSGSLVSRLATDSAILQSMTSDFLNRSLMTGTTFIIIFAISFYYSWEMTLIMIVTTPFLVGVNFVRLQQMSGQMNAKKNNHADAAAGSLLSEAIDSIRTVASFGMEKSLTQQYAAFLDISNDQDKKLSVSGGVSFGLSQCMMFWVLAFVFHIGGILVSHGTISFEDLFVVLMVFMMGSFSVSMASQGSVDGDKAKRAAADVFKIIDRVPEIDATSTAGIVLPSIQGDIDFKQLTFAYPSRPDAVIYQGYDLSVGRGQTVALVGASGSGKSTAIALLERFYDPSSGLVTLDGHDVRSLSLPWLRDRISLVSQEPVLFSGTIAENIALGKPGASRAEVEAAAKSANAFDFISNFPRGFDTEVGDRGAQVSGGQKQRIAIARAILRDPDVLLLDEATSALDNESEHIVQASLDALMTQKRRTTIVVAHRLSTIRKADAIAVTREGAIVELGSHEELMRLPGGVYRGMVELQTGTI
ncbi:ABC transporter B family member 11 [Phytophthora ramorum]|uniref:ABC transporter B family member 11 n=1 Tax=Phytophthora ramorum TaxID=164328 RepID=UPI0030B3745B|nr:ABC transporter B family member 11 [Phytophthora ramorum]